MSLETLTLKELQKAVGESAAVERYDYEQPEIDDLLLTEKVPGH
jgi:hypothetical protein